MEALFKPDQHTDVHQLTAKDTSQLEHTEQTAGIEGGDGDLASYHCP